MKFDGSQWVTVGSPGFIADKGINLSLAVNPMTGQPYVAYTPNADVYKLTVMKFDGSQWVTVGSAGFSPNETGSVNLSFDLTTGQPYVAYANFSNALPPATVMRFGSIVDPVQCSKVGLNYESDYNSILNGISGKNLVVITHGWNGHGSDTWIHDMQNYICGHTNGNTMVIAFDWSTGKYTAGTGGEGTPAALVTSTLAYDHAYGNDGFTLNSHDGPAWVLSRVLEKVNSSFQNIHLIAHSAGSNVIQSAVDLVAIDYHDSLISVDTMPEIQLTFLDAFIPYAGQIDRFGSFKGGHSDWQGLHGYADHYVDSVTDLTKGDFPWTNIQMSNATNFDVTYLTPTSNRTHTYPYDFYNQSIDKTKYDPNSGKYVNIPGNGETVFKMGFPFSSESDNHVDFVSHTGKWCIVTNVAEPYRRCVGHSVEENRDVILTDPDKLVPIESSSGVIVDVSQFVQFNPEVNQGMATATLPPITLSNPSHVEIDIQNHTTVTSDTPGWNGLFSTPTETTIPSELINTPGKTTTIGKAIAVGFAGGKLSFDTAVKIVMINQKGLNAAYTRDNLSFTPIPNCLPNQTDGSNLPPDGDCKMNVGNDLVIWTKHFTTFATYSQADSGPSPIEAPVYRFWSNAKKHHFFTISAPEKDTIIATDPSWHYEGIAYNAFTTSDATLTPVYRFWSDAKQGHFFTVSSEEKDNIIATDPSWRYEGIAYYAYATEQPNTQPVYRFWSDAKQGHFFTVSSAEKDSIIATDPSWHYEGISWYVPMQ